MNEGMIENSLNLIIQRLASSDYVAVSQKVNETSSPNVSGLHSQMTQSRGSPGWPSAQGFESPLSRRRRWERGAGSAILGKPEHSTLPRLDIPAANTPSHNHSQPSRAQEHIVDHQQTKTATLRKPCFPTTQPLSKSKPWPLFRMERNRGTTGRWRWIPTAPLSLDNSNNQPWIKMWINILAAARSWNTNNLKSEQEQWRTDGGETNQGKKSAKNVTATSITSNNRVNGMRGIRGT